MHERTAQSFRNAIGEPRLWYVTIFVKNGVGRFSKSEIRPILVTAVKSCLLIGCDKEISYCNISKITLLSNAFPYKEATPHMLIELK